MRFLLSLVLSVCSLSLFAQTPYLVKDINTTRSTNVGSSLPSEFAALGNNVFFAASTTAAGNELWVSDGTSGGATLFDLVPGSSSPSPSGLMAVNGVMLFNARDVNHGIELWTSDGTAAGTHLLLDINPGPSSGEPSFKFLYNNRVLFSADDGVNGRELWVSDGTAAGTHLLKDLNTGSGSSSPFNFVLFNNRVYFFAAGALWKTDGTEAGTVKVAAVSGRGMVVAGSKLFFEGFTADAGVEPWVSDGTDAGTRMVADILPGAKGSLETSYFLPAAAIGNGIVFLANDGVHGRELWASDGTAAGTRMVRDFLPGPKGKWDTAFALLTAFDGRAFFSASDDQHGEELWVTDGTDAGTQLFLDLNPGPASSFPISFAVNGGKLYFVALPSVGAGFGLWVSDGSVAGTHRFLGVSYASNSTFVSVPTFWPSGGKVYFAGSTPLTGGEPWVTDGTDAGTRMIANVAADAPPGSFPAGLTAAGNLLFFFASDGVTGALWRSDGTDAGTFKLRDSDANTNTLVSAGSFVLFPEHPYDSPLLMSDGTVAGTKSANDFLRRFGGGGRFSAIYPSGDTLYVTMADAGGSQKTLWKTTTAPNAPAVLLGPKNAAGLVDVAGREMFTAQLLDGTRRSLWSSDGTPEGTVDVVPDLGDAEGVSDLVNAEGTLFFLKQLRGETTKLWKSDGTFDGTVVVKDLLFQGGYSYDVKAAGRRLFFMQGNTLWTSDGTEAGTIALTTLKRVDDGARILQPAGSRVVFTQYDPANSIHELWTSDGTPEGTKLLQRLGSYLPGATSIDGVVYFGGIDDAHGVELWSTDGTPEGTKLVADVNPGAGNSYPYNFTKVGDLIYFSAYTDAAGGELWALPASGPSLAIGDARVAEGDNVVRLTVSLSPAAAQAVTVDYATSDGTAKAGQDYDAASGTLTFAAGETSKTVDVRVHGDAAVEGNETFYVALRNAHGARVSRGEGAGIIDDDDHAADLSVATAFTVSSFSVQDTVNVANAGPSAATDIVVTFTSTPPSAISACIACPISQLVAGATMPVSQNRLPSVQAYLSASATSPTPDPQPSNNAVSWTLSKDRRMAMTPAFLVTGATAAIVTQLFQSTVPVTSSDPSVVALGSITTSGDVTTIPVTALKPGTSTIASAGTFGSSLLVTVVAPGTTPRWPGGVSMGGAFTSVRFDQPLTIGVAPSGTAPFSGARATGTIVVTVSGQELARRDFDGRATLSVPIYLPNSGDVPYRIAYSGDANFLPQTLDDHVFVAPGKATLNATLEAVPGAAGTFALTVTAIGSPLAAPTGTLSVLNGATEIAKVQLVPGDGGSTAHATLANLPPSPSLTVNYSGDDHYISGSQQVRVVIPRSRAAHH